SHGFFRGLGFPFMSYGIVNSIFFGVYGNTLKLLTGGDKTKATYWDIYRAGCIGGAAQLVVACPVEVIKVILQARLPNGQCSAHAAGAAGSTSFRGPLDCLCAAYRRGGLRAFYTGFGVNVLLDVNAASIYFLVYEWLYSQMMLRQLTDSHGVIAGGAAG
ncbi:Solute carrier family 25 member 45, partial [Lamellibrachia satsuma]